MKSKLALILTSLSFLLATLPLRTANAQEPIREFVLASSYGVLAGTLVGAATLAFSDRPGDNLNKVARGASIGLYCGILLGFYIVYGVPSEEDEEGMVMNSDEASSGKYRLSMNLSYTAPKDTNGLAIGPMLGEKGLDGAQASLRVYSF